MDQLISEKQRGRGIKFERIRRITGYLTGSLDTWVDSKQHEERARVTHTTAEMANTSAA